MLRFRATLLLSLLVFTLVAYAAAVPPNPFSPRQATRSEVVANLKRASSTRNRRDLPSGIVTPTRFRIRVPVNSPQFANAYAVGAQSGSGIVTSTLSPAGATIYTFDGGRLTPVSNLAISATAPRAAGFSTVLLRANTLNLGTAEVRLSCSVGIGAVLVCTDGATLRQIGVSGGGSVIFGTDQVISSLLVEAA